MGCSLKSVVSPLPAIVREGAVGFRLPVHRAYFDRNLIGGAADAARPNFDRRHHVFQRLLENRQRALLGLGLDHAERTVDDAFGDRLLPGIHHRVHEFRNDDVSELWIRIYFTFFGRMATRHLVSFVMAGLGAAIHVLNLLLQILGRSLRSPGMTFAPSSWPGSSRPSTS